MTEDTTARTPKSLETLIHEISNNKWTVARAEYIAARAKLEAFTRAADEVEKLIPAIPYTKEGMPYRDGSHPVLGFRDPGNRREGRK